MNKQKTGIPLKTFSMHRDPYCTTNQCKCYENGQQQEHAAILHYIQQKTYTWHGREEINTQELVNQLINGAHRA